jgi:hypothetical protein
MSNSSRRAFLRGSASLVVLSAAAACKKESKPFTCTEVSALSPADTAVRTALGYVEPSPEPGKDCAGCVQFTASPSDAAGACGGCKLMKGPIHPKGYCKGFAAKSA